ncbi:hypothetical protein V8G54_007091 [Vigna mungo]|uniref:Uncharacterized protein n=1 Tax=Vigna mungo TaxID=3915 RepID=A0AAQ3P118_VIGMU
MGERTLVPIFVFWAFLTMITPTLILLSENSKADLQSNGNITEGVKLERMIVHTENYIIKTASKPDKFEEELAPAPEPLPTTATVTPTVSLSHQNRFGSQIVVSSNLVEEEQFKLRNTEACLLIIDDTFPFCSSILVMILDNLKEKSISCEHVPYLKGLEQTSPVWFSKDRLRITRTLRIDFLQGPPECFLWAMGIYE